MSLEREAKLAATPAFELPPMDGLVRGATAVTLARLELEATYYDTAEFQLARWGVTLRHRTGEPGPAWTLKLPGTAAGATLERRELGFAGEGLAIPPEAADLVRAYVRGRALVPAARLHTSRHPIEIRDPDGTVLAEVADDGVSVRVGRRVTGRFREIEIEAKDDGRRGRAVLRAAVERLTAAGCTSEQPVPKLIRALGAAASRPAEVALVDLGAHPGPYKLARHAIAGSVVQLIGHDALVRLGEDEEGVHKFRVATRRLRSDLGTFAEFLDGEQAGWLREELRWLGGEVGRVRDNHVLAGNLQRDIDALPAADVAPAQHLIKRLRRQARNARVSMLASLRSERYDLLLESLVRMAGSSSPLPEGIRSDHGKRHAAMMDNLVRKRWGRLDEAVSALVSDPSDAALHAVRIKAKQCRYTAEAVTPVAGDRTARFAVAVSRLQTVLGDHQDTVVAERWLREAADVTPVACLVAGELIARQRAERARLRAAWPAVWKEVFAKRPPGGRGR